MYHFNYQDLWKKMFDIFQPIVTPTYDHQGLTDVVHKWVKSK